MEIITDFEILATPAEPLKFITDEGINKTEGEEIISQLKELIIEKNLTALAAPQIGKPYRIFCINFNGEIKTFINPIITKKNKNVILPEIFANDTKTEYLISRPEEITIVYYNDEFKYEENKLLGAAARLFDQFAQLLDGILPSTLGIAFNVEEAGSIIPLFSIENIENLTEEELLEIKQVQDLFINQYKEFISAKLSQVEKTIEEKDELYYKNLKMCEQVINGRAQIVRQPEQAPFDKFTKQRANTAYTRTMKQKAAQDLRTFISKR